MRSPCAWQNFVEVRDPGHRPVLVHDLAEDGGRVQARDAREVDGRLRLAGSLEHAAALRAQREHVAGAVEVRRLGRRVDRGQHRGRAVRGGDAGRRAPSRLDGDRERRAEVGRVLLDHRRQFEGVAALLGQREADETAALARHEVDRLRGDLLRGQDEVALVLAVLVVDDDDEPAGAQGGDGVLDGGERRVRHHPHSLMHPSGVAAATHFLGID
jgi:hypothetical protein